MSGQTSFPPFKVLFNGTNKINRPADATDYYFNVSLERFGNGVYCDGLTSPGAITLTFQFNSINNGAADPYYQGILDATEEELVSIDYRGNSHSSIVDLKLTDVIGGTLIKVVAWYDNEWGYSNRLVELTADLGKMGQ